MRPAGSPVALEKRRHKAIQLLQKGLRPVEVARVIGVDRRSVRRWKSAYRQQGLSALKAKPAMGRPSRLTVDCKRNILRMIKKSPQAAGFKAEDWTYELISQAIRKKFGVTYHRNYIGPLIRAINRAS